MSDQWAKVPLELVRAVDANALQLYVVIVGHTSRTSCECRALNPRLAELTGQSLATLKRSLRQLVQVGAVEPVNGRRRRVLRVTNRLTGEPKGAANRLMGEPPIGSWVSHPSEPEVSEPEAHSLRSCAATDESELTMIDDNPEALFPVELPDPAELPIGRQALERFFDEYGQAPISRPMIARLGRRFKELAVTYDAELVLAAAAELGRSGVANPNAAESYVLRLQRQQQRQQSGWSGLATQAFDRWADEEARSV